MAGRKLLQPALRYFLHRTELRRKRQKGSVRNSSIMLNQNRVNQTLVKGEITIFSLICAVIAVFLSIFNDTFQAV
jgi:hypothetical protein